jgi:RNA polymerase sigma factor (sigma-70 family)
MGGATTLKRAPDVERTKLMETIMAQHETALLRYAARILNSPSAAQDVVQNVFIKLFRGWKEGTQPSPRLKSWLYRVTHNEAVDHIRRESRLKTLHENHAEEFKSRLPNRTHSRGVSMGEKQDLVLDLVQKLHPREQQVVLLRIQEGLSYKEISSVTGRTRGNVGNILHHAVKKLSQELKRAGKLPDYQRCEVAR